MAKSKTKEKRISYKERVNTIFEGVVGANGFNETSRPWVDELKQRALKNQSGWKYELDAYLWGSGSCVDQSSDLACKLRAQIAEIGEAGPSWLSIIFCALSIIMVCIILFSSQALYSDKLIAGEAIVFGLIVGGFLITQQNRQRKISSLETKGARFDSYFIIVAGAVLIPLFVVAFSAIVGESAKWLSVNKLKKDLTQFKQDPDGFQFVQNFALENYGVTVVLANADDSWVSLTLNLPGASPASMGLGPGYCELSMSPEGVVSGFKLPNSHNDNLLLRGVMMHELAHCLDIKRDYPTFDNASVRTFSISPVDAGGVADIKSYLVASDKNSTKQWREAFADIYAIGYWGLTAPLEAPTLSAGLREKRALGAQKDRVHATACWIDYAIKSTPPKSIEELMAWAEKNRADAPCPNNGQKQISATAG